MSEKRYPTRMHEVLGVEPEERFMYSDYGDREFWLSESGLMYRIFNYNTSIQTEQGTLVLFINNPERITRRPRYTPEQVEQLKALKVLGMGKWWLAKDGNGDVYTYKRKPKKDSTVWDYYDENGTNAYIPMTTSLVSWSDPEPLSIAQALRDAEVEA